MWKTFLLLACAIESFAIVSCQGNPSTCGKYQVYYNCFSECRPLTCSGIGFPLNCDDKCTPGCVCKDNYVQADNGTCIPILDCPSCGGDKNAQRGCSNYCGNTCSTYNKPLTSCPVFCMFNGCECRNGFVYDNNLKACVKPEDCTPTCQANEEYSSCTNGGCEDRNCSQVGKPVPGIKLDPNSCIEGCVCVKGYLRASNGTCVPRDQCTTKTCGKNEHWEECYYSCGGNQRCSDIGKKYNCPAEQKCYSGCRCNKGYWRNKDNVCIPENQCPKLCGANEYFENCITDCTTQSCSEYGRAARSCPGQIIGQCPSGCRCKPKYYRNGAGVCVPESECPRCYGLNEYYEYCIKGCYNQTCDDIGKQCPSQPAGQCKAGCICAHDYWRNGSDVCVLQEACRPKETSITTAVPTTTGTSASDGGTGP